MPEGFWAVEFRRLRILRMGASIVTFRGLGVYNDSVPRHFFKKKLRVQISGFSGPKIQSEDQGSLEVEKVIGTFPLSATNFQVFKF